MPSGAPIRRVGGLAVALGVGAAVISGWSSGPAWADESSGSSGSTTSGSAAGTKPGSAESSGASVEADSPATSSGTGTTTAGAVDGEPASRPGVTPPGSEEPEITSATPPETSADEDEPTAEPRTPKGSDRRLPTRRSPRSWPRCPASPTTSTMMASRLRFPRRTARAIRRNRRPRCRRASPRHSRRGSPWPMTSRPPLRCPPSQVPTWLAS